MDPPAVPVNPPTKAPVIRGARACTVCRQAKMKCVGAEDGTKRCQRCQRSGVECVFEKHRRGRKPGSKLSEASKMLRRLEKGLNNAKAKQPANASHPQPSSSTAQYSQEDHPQSSSYPGPSSGNSQSGHQSDDDMDEDEEDRPDEALYPARVIRSANRSSFLDIVMNKDPSESSPPQSASPTDRLSHPQPKAPSQSPTRSHSSPQPKPSSSLFAYVPKDPVEAGIVPDADVPVLFDAFFLRLNPFINLFDPALHSVSYVRARSPFLFTTMLMACCKFFRPDSYQAVRRLAHEWCVYTFAEGTESVEIVQALACMTYWKEPADKRTWTYIGMACRMAVNIQLNRYVGPRLHNESENQLLERRNRERTYLVLFVHDRSLSMQTGKNWMLSEHDELVQHARTWHEEGGVGHRPDVRPEDVIVAAFVNLRLIGSEATDMFYNRRDRFDSELHKYNARLDQWLSHWIGEMRKAPLADPFHSHFLQFFQSHVKLFLNTFGLNMARLEASRSVPSTEAVHQCVQSARTNLQIVSKDFAGTHVLRYGQESITVMSAYAAIVLLKLLRNPNITIPSSTEEIHNIINKTADAYQNAGHVTGSELDSTLYHSRFLRRLTAEDLERSRQRPERNGFRPDGIPASFAQGLPPIQPLIGMPITHADSYLPPRGGLQHGMGPAQLAPLSIPGGSSHNVHQYSPPSHADYDMDPARSGFSHGVARAGPSYPTTDQDENYWRYMIGEVGDTLARADSSPDRFMANGGMSDFGYAPTNHYREPAPLPTVQMYGAHGSGRPSYLPPMHPYTSNSFNGNRPC